MLSTLVAGLLRRTWLVGIATIAICSVFAARAMAAFSAATLGVAVPAVAPPPPPPPLAPRAKLDGDILVERNIFCSTCTPPAPEAAGPTAGGTYHGEPATLIATSLGAAPRATVRVIASQAQGSWALGETIPGVGTIARIGGSTIDVVDAAGNTGTLALVEPSHPGGRTTPETAAATAASAPAAPASPFEGRIEKLGDHRYRVDRELVRELVMGTTRAKGVRALPVVKHGEVQGLRLVGVKADSIAAAVGIRSGDVFDSIDGVKIKNAQQLLDLFTKLDSVSNVELSGTRVGKPLAIQMQLR